MPHEVLCEKCGEQSRVVTRTIDDGELAGIMPAGDERFDNGFFIRIECPHCGQREQAVAPPP